MNKVVNIEQLQVERDIFDKHILEKNYNGVYNKVFKRLIGLFISSILLIILLPVFFIVSIAIIIDSGYPVFYRANRGGYNNKSFKIYKFRTMVNNADKIGGGTTALNDKRITKVGNFLRKTKLDEIPQLINIIKGEMSFIGPRPELIKYTSQYNDKEKMILKVRPGITDYSSIEFIDLDQVVGIDNADEIYEKHVLKRKNYLRLKYVKNVSFKVDFILFCKTIKETVKKALLFVFRERSANGKSITKEL